MRSTSLISFPPFGDVALPLPLAGLDLRGEASGLSVGCLSDMSFVTSSFRSGG